MVTASACSWSFASALAYPLGSGVRLQCALGSDSPGSAAGVNPFQGCSSPTRGRDSFCPPPAEDNSVWCLGLPLGAWCDLPLDSEALARLETQVGAYWSLGNVEAETLAQYLLAHFLQLGSSPCCLARQCIALDRCRDREAPFPWAIAPGTSHRSYPSHTGHVPNFPTCLLLLSSTYLYFTAVKHKYLQAPITPTLSQTDPCALWLLHRPTQAWLCRDGASTPFP